MGLLRAVRIIVTPAIIPLTQVVAVFGLAISFFVIVAGIFAEPPRDHTHMKYIFCTIQVQRLTTAVEKYRADCGQYPNAIEGLQALVTSEGVKGWHGPYIKEVPLDPWGRPFLYLRSAGSARPEIPSYGADGRPGGESVNAEVSSMNSQHAISETPFEIQARWLMKGIWIGAWICFSGCIVGLRMIRHLR